MNTNDPRQFWPEEGGVETSGSEGSAHEARAPQHASGISEPQKGGHSLENKKEEDVSGASQYRAPGMPVGTPQRIPDEVKIGSELPPSASIKQEDEKPLHSQPDAWDPSEEDDEGVVHTGAEGARQQGNNFLVIIFFAVIILVVIGVFLYQYFSLTLGTK